MSGITYREPGIYFGLDEALYHADGALGSSGIKQLYSSPPDYWWNSPRNPLRPVEKEADHLTFGKAVHLRVLEGAQAFDARYARAPDPAECLVSDADVTGWITTHGAEIHDAHMAALDNAMDRGGADYLLPDEKAALDLLYRAAGEGKLPKNKADKVRLVRLVDPTVPILDAIYDDAAARGVRLLKPEDYDRVVAASAMIEANPDLSEAFAGGCGEVSVFWREVIDGVEVPCKARFDYLKVRGIGDLKTIGNPLDLPFKAACRRAIATYRYDIQAGHYLEGRRHLRALHAAGQVYGDHEPEWLARVAAQDEFGFAFVFIKSQGAPLTWGVSVSPGNPIIDIAMGHRLIAMESYARFLTRYGAEAAWVAPEPVEELDIDEMPAWWGRT